MKKILAFLLCLAMVSATLVSCGGDGDGSTPGDVVVMDKDGNISGDENSSQGTIDDLLSGDPNADPGTDDLNSGAIDEDGKLIANKPLLNGAVAEENAVYRVLYSGELTTLNYLVTANSNEMTVGANTVDSLIEYDNKGAIKAGLAEKWESNEDATVWTFTLRKGQKWLDNTGTAKADVTAKDFVSAIKYSLTPENESATVQNLFGKIKNAKEYYNGLAYKDTNGEEYDDDGNVVATWPEISFDEVGVKATDNYTLVYTLVEPCPYFLSSLTYITYLPAYGPLLEELGKEFGSAADKMYYCGAFYLSEWKPNEKRVLKKNPGNYDADLVHISTIEYKYNNQASAVAPEMILKGEIDYAALDSAVAADWEKDDVKSQYTSPSRTSVDYSYFYCFNFDPKFDAEYEPENWKIAVNNENFRKAVLYAMNKVDLMSITANDDAAEYVYDSITLPTFCANASGKDFSAILPATVISKTGDSAKAVSFRDAAKSELAAAGATFPIKMLVSYNPTFTGWDNECSLLKQQLEDTLGTDFIKVEVVPGPSSSFLSEVRRSGKYAFLKCNWGADYQDPETWTDPFYQESLTDGYKYNFMYQSVVDGGASAEVIKGYYALVKAAKEIKSDVDARYEAFAKAEAYLIDHALVIPYGVSPADVVATKLCAFEGQFASFGISSLRYKGQYLYDHYITWAEFLQSKALVEKSK